MSPSPPSSPSQKNGNSPEEKSLLHRLFRLPLRAMGAWFDGITSWTPEEESQTLFFAVWTIGFLVLFLALPPLLLQIQTAYHILVWMAVALLIGWVNYGLKKLSQSRGSS